MRQREQLQVDLLASMSLALLSLGLIFISPIWSQWVTIPIALALASLPAGYALIALAFPGKDDLSVGLRIVLSLASSTALALAMTLGFQFTPWKIDLASASTILAVLAIAFSILAYIRRLAMPRRRRFIFGSRRSLRSARGGISTGIRTAWPKSKPASKRFNLYILLFLLAATVLALTVWQIGSRDSGDRRFTELYVLGPGGVAYDSAVPVSAGSPSTVKVGIANHEGRTVEYTLKLVLRNTTLYQTSISLDSNQTWENPVRYTPKGTGKRLLQFQLFKDGNNTAPYQEHDLWISVSGGEVSENQALKGGNHSTSDEKNADSKLHLTKAQDTNPETVISGSMEFINSAPSTSQGQPSSQTSQVESAQAVPDQRIDQDQLIDLSASQEKEQENPTAPLSQSSDNSFNNSIKSDNSTILNNSASKFLPNGNISSTDESKADQLQSSDLAARKANGSEGDKGMVSGITQGLDTSLNNLAGIIESADTAPKSSSNNSTANITTSNPTINSATTSSRINDTSSNQPPILISLTPDQTSPQLMGTTVTWRASANDPEDVVNYRFSLDGKPVTGWGRLNSWIWLTSSYSPGDYNISVWVRDGKHADKSSFDSALNASFTITSQNEAPALKGLKSDKQSPMAAGATITWTAEAVDADHDPILYRFLQNGQPALGWSGSNSWSWKTSDLAPGDYDIQVQVRDGKHAGPDAYDSSLNANFAITSDNQPPVLRSLKPDKSSPQPVGTTITWTAEANDPEDSISYKFLQNDAAITDWSQSNSWVWKTSGLESGEYQITVLVRDGKHAAIDSSDCSLHENFIITAENQPPLLTDLESSKPSPQTRGAAIQWTAKASDPDNDHLVYRFFMNGEPETGWSTSNIWVWSTADALPGDYKISVWVRDGKHAGIETYDSSKDVVFTIASMIQQEIDVLISKRGPGASDKGSYTSGDIKISSGNSSSSKVVLGSRGQKAVLGSQPEQSKKVG